MAFKVSNAMIDVINGSGNVVAFDTPPNGPNKTVQISFPFNPPPAEGKERDRLIAEAKKVLQQALNEIS